MFRLGNLEGRPAGGCQGPHLSASAERRHKHWNCRPGWSNHAWLHACQRGLWGSVFLLRFPSMKIELFQVEHCNEAESLVAGIEACAGKGEGDEEEVETLCKLAQVRTLACKILMKWFQEIWIWFINSAISAGWHVQGEAEGERPKKDCRERAWTDWGIFQGGFSKLLWRNLFEQPLVVTFALIRRILWTRQQGSFLPPNWRKGIQEQRFSTGSKFSMGFRWTKELRSSQGSWKPRVLRNTRSWLPVSPKKRN